VPVRTGTPIMADDRMSAGIATLSNDVIVEWDFPAAR
jgi:hypothetical protein